MGVQFACVLKVVPWTRESGVLPVINHEPCLRKFAARRTHLDSATSNTVTLRALTQLAVTDWAEQGWWKKCVLLDFV